MPRHSGAGGPRPPRRRPPTCSPRSSARCARSPPTATGARRCGSAGTARRAQLFRTASFAAMRASIAPAAPHRPDGAAAERRLPADRDQSARDRRRPAGPESLSPQHQSTGKSTSRPTPARAAHLRRRRAGHLRRMDAMGRGRPVARAARPRAGPARIRDADPVRLRPADRSAPPRSRSSSCGTGGSARPADHLRGRMYKAAHPGDPPPSRRRAVRPRPLARRGGAALVVTFSGAAPSAPGTTITPHRRRTARATPAASAQRRETMRGGTGSRSTGLSLDFGATGFIGLAIWANGPGADRAAAHQCLVRQPAT